MTDKTQPEALRLADWLDADACDLQTPRKAAAELRRQHARIAELEAELEAVGAGGVQALQPEGGPPGSGGWQHHAETMERERDHWRERARTMEEHQRGTVWYWQGDGNDHPESMVNSLPVVIRADQLRALIAGGVQALSAAPAGWKLVPVEPTDEMLKAADDGDDEYTLRNFGPGVQRVMQGPYDHYCAMLAASPTPPAEQQAAPKAAPAWEHHARKLTQWLHCMSHNDSYFGEPAGLVKQVTGELNRLIGAAPQQEAQEPAFVDVSLRTAIAKAVYQQVRVEFDYKLGSWTALDADEQQRIVDSIRGLYTAPQPAPDCHHRPPCDECAAKAKQGGRP